MAHDQEEEEYVRGQEDVHHPLDPEGEHDILFVLASMADGSPPPVLDDKPLTDAEFSVSLDSLESARRVHAISPGNGEFNRKQSETDFQGNRYGKEADTLGGGGEASSAGQRYVEKLQMAQPVRESKTGILPSPYSKPAPRRVPVLADSQTGPQPGDIIERKDSPGTQSEVSVTALTPEGKLKVKDTTGVEKEVDPVAYQQKTTSVKKKASGLPPSLEQFMMDLGQVENRQDIYNAGISGEWDPKSISALRGYKSEYEEAKDAGNDTEWRVLQGITNLVMGLPKTASKTAAHEGDIRKLRDFLKENAGNLSPDTMMSLSKAIKELELGGEGAPTASKVANLKKEDLLKLGELTPEELKQKFDQDAKKAEPKPEDKSAEDENKGKDPDKKPKTPEELKAEEEKGKRIDLNTSIQDQIIADTLLEPEVAQKVVTKLLDLTQTSPAAMKSLESVLPSVKQMQTPGWLDANMVQIAKAGLKAIDIKEAKRILVASRNGG